MFILFQTSSLWPAETGYGQVQETASVDLLLIWFISSGPSKQWCCDFAWQRFHLFNIPWFYVIQVTHSYE